LKEETNLSLSGLVLSASFSLADGALDDVKVDVCAHCLPRMPADWARILERFRLDRGLLPLDIMDGLLCGQCELAFVGFGVKPDGDERLNLYLKAPAKDQ
jgi:hypothetical protein